MALERVGKPWDRGEIKFSGVQLSAAEQGLLLAICARTGRSGLRVYGDARKLLAEQLSLSLRKSAKNRDLGRVVITASSLLLDAGMGTGGDDYRRLLQYLNNLAAVSVVIFHDHSPT
ncbi:MAG: hypothetical protein ACYDAI_19510 [Trichloromonadaceae bacterium]